MLKAWGASKHHNDKTSSSTTTNFIFDLYLSSQQDHNYFSLCGHRTNSQKEVRGKEPWCIFSMGTPWQQQCRLLFYREHWKKDLERVSFQKCAQVQWNARDFEGNLHLFWRAGKKVHFSAISKSLFLSSISRESQFRGFSGIEVKAFELFIALGGPLKALGINFFYFGHMGI